MKRRLYQLDVFTTAPYEGNPLAVITDGDGLSSKRMQAVAREMNLSETVFIQKPTSNRALARLRIFTTTTELPLAGHPVIGTWFLLATLGVVPAQEGAVHVWQQTGAGILPVEIAFHNGRPQRVTMTQKPAEFRAARMNRGALARALGLGSRDFHPSLPLEYVSTAVFILMVPLRRRSVLERIRLNMHALAGVLGDRGLVAYCFAVGERNKVFARGMLPWELGEDPATGAAGGALGAYLTKHGKLETGRPLEILQGLEMGRPSHIHVEVTKQDERGGRPAKLIPRVSGSAVLVLEGHIEA